MPPPFAALSPLPGAPLQASSRPRGLRRQSPPARPLPALSRAITAEAVEDKAPNPGKRALLGALTLLLGGSQTARAAVAAAPSPLADVPLLDLALPKGGAGSATALVKVTIGEKGPFDFMVDSGLTGELITPHLRDQLGIKGGGTTVSGIGAGGATAAEALVDLEGAAICCGNFRSGSKLPLPLLHAVVTDYPQEHIDPAHDPVEGMLGQEALRLFDTDFDFPRGRLRLWAPGEGVAAAMAEGLVEVPGAQLNETGLLGVRLTSPAAPARAGGTPQPVVGIVDTGASFSAANWAAAGLLGLPPRGDKAYEGAPGVQAFGVDGRPMVLPTAPLGLTFVGDASGGGDGAPFTFAAPPARWQPWKPTRVAVGDLPVFAEALGQPGGGYRGPAVLLGMDVLRQRRLVLGAPAAGQGRRRTLAVGPQ